MKETRRKNCTHNTNKTLLMNHDTFQLILNLRLTSKWLLFLLKTLFLQTSIGIINEIRMTRAIYFSNCVPKSIRPFIIATINTVERESLKNLLINN